MATYVLVHGGWDGGWSWRDVATKLREAGHEVFTPTLTGSGERVHLARRDTGLDTHIQDVVNVFRYEELDDVTLVGLSYGGMVITGVAEEVPGRIERLVYLDAFLPRDGESAAELAGPEIAAAMEEAARAYGDGWRVPHDPPDADRRTDFLLRAAQQRITVENPQAARLDRTFVHFTEKSEDDFTGPLMARMAGRAREEGLTYREMSFGHFPLLDRPEEVAGLLMEVG